MKYNSIGKIVAVHGLEGELVLKHGLGKKTSLRGLESLFIEVRKGELLPYFISVARGKNDQEIYLQLDDVTSREAAQKLLSREVWLLEEDFQQYAAAHASISFLGFTIWSNKEELGEVLEVIEQPHQVLCRINLNGKEALIPVHEQSLVNIDVKNKRVDVNLPEGLLDIYR